MVLREGAYMTGVSFMVDDAGKKTAVVLDLRKHRRVWEDVYDRLLIESRRKEPRESLAQVRAHLAAKSRK
jgi:hypothetical protein